jgi:hypothetical protein
MLRLPKHLAHATGVYYPMRRARCFGKLSMTCGGSFLRQIYALPSQRQNHVGKVAGRVLKHIHHATWGRVNLNELSV